MLSVRSSLLFGFAGTVQAAFGIGRALQVSWLVERKRVRLVIPCKCNGSFLSVGILGAASADGCSVRQWHLGGAGEQKSPLLLRRRVLWKRSVLTGTMLTAGTGSFADDERGTWRLQECPGLLMCFLLRMDSDRWPSES